MSLASTLLAPPRQRGRPKDCHSYCKFKTKARWAYLILTHKVSVAEAAGANGVDRRTISRWLNDVLTSDEPEAEGLRRLTEQD